MAKPGELSDWLKPKSREELTALIEELVRREPELLDTVELLIQLGAKPARAGSVVLPTIDPAQIRRQVLTSFRSAGRGWGYSAAIAGELEELTQMADKFSQAGKWEDARLIYMIIAQEASSHYEEIEEEADIFPVIEECVNALVEYLDQNYQRLGQNNPILMEVLKLFYELWKFERNYGGFEEALDEIILAYTTTPQEKELVRGWIRADLQTKNNWQGPALIKLLAELQEKFGEFNQEELLAEYRKAELYKELAYRLLELNRLDEALKLVEDNRLQADEATSFADKLLIAAPTRTVQVLQLITAQLEAAEKTLQGKKAADYTRQSEVFGYRRWLAGKYLQLGESQKALELELHNFESRAGVETYQRVKTAAEQAGKWPELRNTLLTRLEQANHWQALITIYLNEREMKRAVEAVESYQNYRPGTAFYRGADPEVIDYLVRVAEAASAELPEAAIRLYQSAAEKLIELRERRNYEQAANHLSQVKELYLKLDKQADWHQYITGLRNSNKPLRALREELDKKGL